MAADFPDFFGTSVFPQEGAYCAAEIERVVVAAGDKVTLIDLACKGVLRGGWLELSHTTVDMAEVKIGFSIDGALVSWSSVWDVFILAINTPHVLPWTVSVFDSLLEWVIIQLASGVTFMTSLKIELDNILGADSVEVYGKIYYSEVTL